MAFDLSTAKPIGGFALSTARPVGEEKPKREASMGQNIAAGMVKGASDIGATLLTPIDAAARAMGVSNSVVGRTDRRQAVDQVMKGAGIDTDSFSYGAGKLGSEIAGAAGMGGLLAKVLGAIPGMAAGAGPLLEAIATSGMRAGGATGAGGVALRAAGGAFTGGASAGLVNPSDAGTGAVIGGAFAPAAMAVGKGAQAVGAGYRALRTPAETKSANKLAEIIGMTSDDLAAALNQQGPTRIPGYGMTVPQILQAPAISQLQRTLKTAGNDAIGSAERAQQEAYRAALNRVAPVANSVQDAAERTGRAIQDFAMPAREQATKKVRAAFDAVDPFNESALYLPIEQMRAAESKYLGPGTFGTGGKAAQAIRTAEEVGTETLPAVVPLNAGPVRNAQSLERAVRAAGGIRGKSGELRDLGIRQSGTTGLINNKSGQSEDILAAEMHRRGFIPDADPRTLLDALRNGGGRRIYANDQVENNALQRMTEAAMGDAPGAETVAKLAPFQTVQNLRSSIVEAAEQASAKGANKEAAALRQMVAEIDSRVNRAAGGSAQVGEYFPKDMADQYRAALAAHAEKMRQFETGPQVGMFRKGADAQPAIQGAEIAGKFFNGNRSQVEDVQAFKRLIGDRADLAQEMKRYAVTQGYSTSNQAGDLTSKFTDWLLSRSGANRELFTPQELATLQDVGKAVERSISAESLGRVTGSDTAQKLQSLQGLGLLDNKAVNILASRTPFIGQFTGPMLSSLRETANRENSNRLAQLLADPDYLRSALGQSPQAGQSTALTNVLQQLMPLTYRAAPVIGVQ